MKRSGTGNATNDDEMKRHGKARKQRLLEDMRKNEIEAGESWGNMQVEGNAKSGRMQVSWCYKSIGMSPFPYIDSCPVQIKVFVGVQ